MSQRAFASALLAFLVVAGCGGDRAREGPSDPFADYAPDPELYAAEAEPADVVAVPAGVAGAPDVRFPVNHLLVLLREEQPRAVAERLTGSLGATIVGQVPSVGLYQLRLPTRTRAELDAAVTLARADPAVEAAGYDVLERTMQCPAPSDNDRYLFFEGERCPFTDIDYYAASTIMDELRGTVTPAEVRVAVVDTGVQQDNGEFDEVSVLNLEDPRARCRDGLGHGTGMASLIAGDDDDAGMNGVASRLLGDRLRLLVGYTHGTPTGAIAAAERATQAGAQVVNLSIGWASYQSGVDIEVIRAAWRRLFSRHPRVLFVAAADNEPYELTYTNYAPGGLQMPNVLTVGGSASCRPAEGWSGSAYGPLVDIVAPAEQVPQAALADGHVVESYNGNSCATAIASAIAAVAWSLDPDLGPEPIKDYLMQVGLPTQLGGRTLGRPQLSMILMQVLLDRAAGVPATALELIDRDRNGEHDQPFLVMTRLCGGVRFEVDGWGAWEFTTGDVERVATAAIDPDGFSMRVIQRDVVYLLMGCVEGCSFELGRPYPISTEALDVPGQVAVSWELLPSPATVIGLGASGALTFDTCRIDQRNPLTNAFMSLAIAGRFEGGLEVAQAGVPGFSSAGFRGAFEVQFVNIEMSPGMPLSDYVERNCEGGVPP